MSKLLDNYYDNKKIHTVLGKDSFFQGDLIFKDSIKINGSFEGSITTSGIVVIGEGALVKANIKAKSIAVFGTIDGDVTAKEKVEMFQTGRVYGDIRAKKIKISDGVIFNGKCEMIN